jgi:hypothetical protein
MLQQFIAIIRVSYYLRSYSSNMCVVDVYGLHLATLEKLYSIYIHNTDIA